MWDALLDVLLLVLAAFVLGTICEHFRQSAILGYLAAGTILGPHALGVVDDSEGVHGLAELGVALLLFSIGLDFSWSRLRSLGTSALLGGMLQVGLTAVFAAGLVALTGVEASTALTFGAIASLSSTACVLRVLFARSEIESVHGRLALGILLFQDLAAVVLMVVVGVFAAPEEGARPALLIARLGLVLAGLVAAWFVIFQLGVPRLLRVRTIQSNRELSILLALVAGLGSAWAAHELGVSPAIGAFLAGMLLAESPYAAAVRADVSSLRTLLVTLFFGSIGMLADPIWVFENPLPVIVLVAALVVGKTLLVWLTLRILRQSHVHALATGIVLAQVGEFSFVLAESARGTLLGPELFQLVVSATLVTLFLTPLLVSAAPSLAGAIVRTLGRARILRSGPSEPSSERIETRYPLVVIGFGPCGEEVARRASEHCALGVLDLNEKLVKEARRRGHEAWVGDAAHPDVVDELHLAPDGVAIVTLPDPGAAESVTRLLRHRFPDARIVVRARYSRHRNRLASAGAHAVIDEERQIGEALAREVFAGLPAEDVAS